jgi:hypothetical protein
LPGTRRGRPRRPATPARRSARGPPVSLSEGTVHAWHRRLRAEVFKLRLGATDWEIPVGMLALRNATGRVRDIDVATEELRRWARSEAPAGLEEAVRSARVGLRSESKRRRAELRRLLRSDLSSAGFLVRTISVDPAIARRGRKEALARLRRARDRAVARASRRRLHRVRKRIRELGLLREIEETGTSRGIPRTDRELRTLMRRLGRSNDRAALIRWVARQRPGTRSSSLVRALRKTQRRDRDAIATRLRRVRGFNGMR